VKSLISKLAVLNYIALRTKSLIIVVVGLTLTSKFPNPPHIILASIHPNWLQSKKLKRVTIFSLVYFKQWVQLKITVAFLAKYVVSMKVNSLKFKTWSLTTDCFE